MKNLRKILKSIDLTPSMFKNAEEKYKNLADFLEEKGFKANVYPQGSFAIGTTTRPYKNGEEQDYDLDAIVEVIISKSSINGVTLMDEIYEVLDSSGIYHDKLERFDKCITINYAKVGEAQFKIDVIPAVPEEDDKKNGLLALGCKSEYVETAIAISSNNREDRNGWYTALPKGYKKWFDDINVPFLAYNREERMHQILLEERELFEKVEDIPEYFNKSSIQEVVQLLHYNRDFYYSKLNDRMDGVFELRPITAIITTFVTKIAEKESPDIDTISLLNIVVKELAKYADYSRMQIADDIISYENGEWKMINPANPLDNLMDAWNTNDEIPKYFFRWVHDIRNIIVKMIAESQSEYDEEIVLREIFGNKLYERTFKDASKLPSINGGPKPWGK